MDPVLLQLVQRTNLGTYREVQAIREVVNGLAGSLPTLGREINTTIFSQGSRLAVDKRELLLRQTVSFNQDLRQLAFLLARILNAAGIDRNRLAEQIQNQNDPLIVAIANFLQLTKEKALEVVQFVQRMPLEEIKGPVISKSDDD